MLAPEPTVIERFADEQYINSLGLKRDSILVDTLQSSKVVKLPMVTCHQLFDSSLKVSRFLTMAPKELELFVNFEMLIFPCCQGRIDY
jgi:hypothetical protein